MHELEIIGACLKKFEITASGTPVAHGDEKNHYLLFLPVHRDARNRQVPANSLLNQARDELHETGISVEFILNDADNRDAESGLRATLLHAFGNDIRNVFLSVTGKNAYVWIDQKRRFEESTRRSMEKKATIFLSELDLSLANLAPITNENTPSAFAMFRAIRLLAPVDGVTLQNHLVSKGFNIPSSDWLNRRLDNLRKAGGIVRLRDAKYTLTLSTIRLLGTEKTGRSPDVTRLLALARREV